MCCLSVLEAEGAKPRCQQDHAPSETPRRGAPFLPLVDGAPGTPHPTSVSGSQGFSPHASVFLQGHSSDWIGVPYSAVTSSSPITSTTALMSSKLSTEELMLWGYGVGEDS